MSDSTQHSMLAGHGQYVKGAAEEIIGSVTGSKEYTESGANDKQAGIEEMRAANAQSSTSSHAAPDTLTGKAENAIGKAVGCEGLQQDYETSDTQQGQRDQFSSSHGEH